MEPDDQKPQFKVVLAPAKGFGRFITLKNNHRVYSSKLLEIYDIIQHQMRNAYDVDELKMHFPSQNLDQGDNMFGFADPFSIEREPPIDPTEEHAGFRRIFDKIIQLKESMGADTLLVICDDVSLLREWYVMLSTNENWVLTHRANEEERKEQRRMRLAFGEHKGKCHLTSVDCIQGQTFENVIYICTRGQPSVGAGLEEVFTGLTRARRMLRILDYSADAWLTHILRKAYDQQPIRDEWDPS